MKHLKMIGLTLAFSVAAACGSSGDIGDLEKLKDEACACKDKACAEAVDKKLNAKLEKMKEPSKQDADTAAQLLAGAGMCIAKHME
jgi:recombinational DNA repair protein (RecF pathway)